MALCIRLPLQAEVVAYDDLGTEALRRLEVEDFPATVINDIYGGDLYEEGKARWGRC
jgi:fumarate hydratase subunit beta